MLVFLLALVILPSPLSGHRVHDFADILPPAIEERLETLSLEVERKTTAELAVVTVTTLEEMTVDEYANRLFNEWGIGKRGTNNGVLFLTAPNERRARIEVGYGLEPLLTDGLVGEILDTRVIPSFKAGDYPDGILAGSEMIAKILRDHPEAARGVADSAPLFVRTPLREAQLASGGALATAIAFLILGFWVSRRRRYSSPLLAAGVLGTVGAGLWAIFACIGLPASEKFTPLLLIASLGTIAFSVVYNVRVYSRYGPRRCPKCSTQLILLDEAKDDEKLDTAQQVEERLGSVDYNVWICPSCLTTDTEAYVARFSDFSVCPHCGHRTYKEEQTILSSPTSVSAGQKRIDGQCVSCRHTTVRHQIIPAIPSSDSSPGGFGGDSGGGFSGGSGGGGFGGGSSGGGGASRGW